MEQSSLSLVDSQNDEQFRELDVEKFVNLIALPEKKTRVSFRVKKTDIPCACSSSSTQERERVEAKRVDGTDSVKHTKQASSPETMSIFQKDYYTLLKKTMSFFII